MKPIEMKNKMISRIEERIDELEKEFSEWDVVGVDLSKFYLNDVRLSEYGDIGIGFFLGDVCVTGHYFGEDRESVISLEQFGLRDLVKIYDALKALQKIWREEVRDVSSMMEEILCIP